MILGLFESSEPAEYGRQNLAKIGAMVIELLTFKVRHGKSDYWSETVIISFLFLNWQKVKGIKPQIGE